MTDATLHTLLDAGLAHAATYAGRLSNHLPMAQQALHDLGANPARLAEWSATYARQLRPVEAGDAEAPWLVRFQARIDTTGASATLAEALPGLLASAGGSAFHGLIRTAHAALASHPGELAAGLAHWAAHPLPLTHSPGAPLPLAAWLDALLTLPRPACPAGSLIAGRMAAWGRSPGFIATAGRLQLAAATLRQLALLAARTYAATGNFTVLHLLTGCHAMTVLAPDGPMRDFTVAAAAGLLASGARPALELAHPPLRLWPALAAAACAQDDEHAIKLTHAAWRLDARWPDPAWRAAAERALPLPT